MAVLDTTFLIAIDRVLPDALEQYELLHRGGTPLRVPAAVWTEYLSGYGPEARAAAADELANATTFEPFTRTLADEAARLQHELRRVGATMAWHDLQIVTTALHYDEPLVSSDARLGRVPGLNLLTV